MVEPVVFTDLSEASASSSAGQCLYGGSTTRVQILSFIVRRSVSEYRI